MNKGTSFLAYRNFVLKHHVFLVRNWEKIRQKQEEVKPASEDVHSASLCTRWNSVCRDDGNIKSGKACSSRATVAKGSLQLLSGVVFKDSFQSTPKTLRPQHTSIGPQSIARQSQTRVCALGDRKTPPHQLPKHCPQPERSQTSDRQWVFCLPSCPDNNLHTARSDAERGRP